MAAFKKNVIYYIEESVWNPQMKIFRFSPLIWKGKRARTQMVNSRSRNREIILKYNVIDATTMVTLQQNVLIHSNIMLPSLKLVIQTWILKNFNISQNFVKYWIQKEFNFLCNSQQNRVTDQKNITIIEVTKAIMQDQKLENYLSYLMIVQMKLFY